MAYEILLENSVVSMTDYNLVRNQFFFFFFKKTSYFVLNLSIGIGLQILTAFYLVSYISYFLIFVFSAA